MKIYHAIEIKFNELVEENVHMVIKVPRTRILVISQ